MEVQYFPQELLDMQEELAKHPPLMEKMKECQSAYLEDRMAHLCLHLGILVDDDFDIDELCELAEMCTKKMYEMRTGLVLSNKTH
jgi:hypothetical protein